MRRAFLDACVVIYLREGEADQRNRISRMLFYETVDIVGSELVRLECRVGAIRKDSSELLAAYDDFFSPTNCILAPMPRSVFEVATGLRAKHRLGMADALHVATALHAGCDEFWTNDDKLSAVSDRLRVVIAR